jgi:hypothetical protein
MSDYPEEVERELNRTMYLGQGTGLKVASAYVMDLATKAFASRHEEADLLRRIADHIAGMAIEVEQEADKYRAEGLVPGTTV